MFTDEERRTWHPTLTVITKLKDCLRLEAVKIKSGNMFQVVQWKQGYHRPLLISDIWLIE